VDGTVARFGRLDVAVNNAGTEGHPGPLTEQTAESYAATFDTNVLGTVLSLKHEAAGHAGARPRQHRQHLLDLRAWRRGQRLDLRGQQARGRGADEIGRAGAGGRGHPRVNAIAPGPTETGMLDRFTGSAERKEAMKAGVPLRRIGQVEELANAILFIASDAASFVTGQILGVDGGKSAG
jgi:NAD(P)-dependent dehydrogenase (short-subunit alcohol dehydrogenase family)